MSVRERTLMSCLLLIILRTASTFWWYLGEEHAPKDCYDRNKLDLTPDQRQDCHKIRNFRDALSFGLSKGIEQCADEFSDRRWNCHTNKKYPNLFGNIATRDSSESGFVYALMAASAVYGMVHKCSDGDIYMCGCKEMQTQADPQPGWSWGGCSDDVDNGVIDKTRQFVDSPHTGRNPEFQLPDKIKLHNNRAGYLAVKDHTETVCKCQGLSGSCTVKTCYQRVPSITNIGAHLKSKYNYAVRVLDWHSHNTWVLYDPTGIVPREEDLVFSSATDMDQFCRQNEAVGSVGTMGRVCKISSYGPDACNSLCCGRSYFERPKQITFDCRCSFIYEHLEMRCDRCTKTVVETICT